MKVDLASQIWGSHKATFATQVTGFCPPVALCKHYTCSGALHRRGATYFIPLKWRHLSATRCWLVNQEEPPVKHFIHSYKSGLCFHLHWRSFGSKCARVYSVCLLLFYMHNKGDDSFIAEMLFDDAVGTERTCTLFACVFKLTHHQMVTGIALYCINLTLWNLTCFVCSVSQWPLNEYIDVIACELSLLKSFIYYMLLCALLHSGETQYNRDKLLQGKCMYKLTSNVCCWPFQCVDESVFSIVKVRASTHCCQTRDISRQRPPDSTSEICISPMSSSVTCKEPSRCV